MNLRKKVYNMTVILASASPRRQALLWQMGLDFKVQAANIDEDQVQIQNPAQLVRALSLAKAQSVAKDHVDALTLAADTVVTLDGLILGKPRDEDEAFRSLRHLAGRSHEVYTGFALLHPQGHRQVLRHEVSTVHIRPLSDEEIRQYIRSGEPMDKAGAYGIQDIGALLVDNIHGDYYNVMGLPLCALSLALKEFGLDLLALASAGKGGDPSEKALQT